MKIIYTFWAFLLNSFGISVFKSCFVGATEDEYGDGLLSGPPITSFIFTTGVYTIISNLNLYPASFRRPPPFFMFIYEFLLTAFILEFSVACIWTPIDLHIYTALARTLQKIFVKLGFNDLGTWIIEKKIPMIISCYVAAVGFLFTSIYVTGAIDFTLYSAYGPRVFSKYLSSKVLRAINTELPDELNDDLIIRGKRAGRKNKKIINENK